MSRSQWSQLYANRRWRKRRADHLASEPLCRYCRAMGRTQEATIADHIEPHRGDMDKFWNGALQSLCATCHSAVKQREESGGHMGCGLDGVPLRVNRYW